MEMKNSLFRRKDHVDQFYFDKLASILFLVF